MRLEVLLSGVVLVTSATSVAALQIPVKGDLGSWFHEDIAVADIDCDNGVCPLKTHSAYDEFLQHWTDTVIQKAVEAQYPKKHVVTIQSYAFSLFRYAQAHPNDIKIKEIDVAESIKRAVYIPPYKRKESGSIGEQAVFGTWKVSRGEQEFVVVAVSWSEGFSSKQQWHIVSDDSKPANDLILDVAKFTTSIHNEIWVFDGGYWSPNRALWEGVQKASWDDVILDSEFKKQLQHDYRSFFKSQDVYNRLNVPWKRGIIFLGPPGNGKTISLKAIMHEVQKIDVPTLYVKTLKSFSGSERSLGEIFSKARQESPCILIFEDLDSIINDRVRSYFLNEVDGLADNDGILMIGTTNHFDRLDPGLSNRPSRFDRKYNFPNPNKDERRQYAEYWQNKLKDQDDIDFPDELVNKFADKTDEFSFAFMKEAFVSALVLIAGGEEDEPDFGKLLLTQVKHLRKEIEDNDGKEVRYHTRVPPGDNTVSSGIVNRESRDSRESRERGIIVSEYKKL